MSKADGSAEWTFTYDADGMRTGRSDGTTTYGYVYNGGQLTQMTVGSDTLTFGYDASGRPQTMTLGGETYYYVTNLQGDVTSITDSSGTWLVHYYYGGYGNTYGTMNANEVARATPLVQLNPLVYRGYVYDRETRLFYLQSRYYNPRIGRFINADALVSTGQGLLGNNMFAYCRNNPVIRVDISGTEDMEVDLDGNNYTEDDHLASKNSTSSIANGGGGGSNAVPRAAYQTRDYVRSHNGSPPPGYRGGKVFANDGRSGSQLLPENRGPYREYDIYPYAKGISRGTERIVIGDGISWYTNDHYMTFIEMEE